MGVAGLWELLRPAGQTRSLTHLSVIDGFESNPAGVRGFRIGIDASIWFFHAAYGKEGENPELRTLFFRCSRLMSMPFLPLFVFDGPKRPSVKRGKRVSGNAHWLTTGMKNIIEAFGFEWRTAPGEAEAELAYLNRIGVIDAVLSDDVDNFLFGATTVIRNPSNTLSGNRAHPVMNSEGRDDGNHAVIYRASDIQTHPDIQLTRGGAILIGLLSGGDYHQAGVTGCGKLIAKGLARCGFGDSLLTAAQTMPQNELPDFLASWREDVKKELRSNSMGHIGSKKPSLASKIPEDFPDIEILLSYTNPITSETENRSSRNQTTVTWDREPDLGKIAGLCELYFEWGVKDIIIKRFRTVLWPSAVLRILRRAALGIDAGADTRTKAGTDVPVPSTPSKKGGKSMSVVSGTPSKMITHYFSSMKISSPKKPLPRSARESGSGSESESESEDRLIVKIHSARNHASTGHLLEFRLEVAPAQLVQLSEDGVKGIRPPIEADDVFNSDDSDDGDEEDEDGDDGKTKTKSKGKTKKAPPDPKSHIRIWMPASMVKMVEPGLVAHFEELQKKKADKKAGKGKGPKRATAKKTAVTEGDRPTSRTEKTKTAPRKQIAAATDDNEDELEYIDIGIDETLVKKKAGQKSKSATTSKSKSTSATTSKPALATTAAAKSKPIVKDFYAVQKSGAHKEKGKGKGTAGSSVSASIATTCVPAPKAKSKSKSLVDTFESLPTFIPQAHGSKLISSRTLSSDDGSDNDSDSQADVLPVFKKPAKTSAAPRPFPIPGKMGKKSRVQSFDSASQSGSESARIAKSPRKNYADTSASPRCKDKSQGPRTPSSCSTPAHRPASPTPTHRRPVTDIIEISSDSDSDTDTPSMPMPIRMPVKKSASTTTNASSLPAKAPSLPAKAPSLPAKAPSLSAKAPLLLAREKADQRQNTTSSKTQAQAQARSRTLVEEDIIDLT
ncbi:hypothetical protein BJ138DRAFT_870624 [Hygrophoropsis aurantiaca]|uniref:Uncharacterized protein n=1 Tax=Hygrophoropsis aurantiaca TaxID=72124 RepID=A0ACB8AEQ6_9AGAM|nr:hypothetical protein BJ138DRAFT_870624 [Hygrophoropsis aurantiaca]